VSGVRCQVSGVRCQVSGGRRGCGQTPRRSGPLIAAHSGVPPTQVDLYPVRHFPSGRFLSSLVFSAME